MTSDIQRPASRDADVRAVLVANARMPSQRAQSVQVAHAVRAFHRVGGPATLLHARRRDTPVRPAAEVFGALSTGSISIGSLNAGDTPESLPGLEAIPCGDWIDAVPRRLQFGPARLQEWTFGRNAVRAVRSRFSGALVLARDVEVAHGLRNRGRVGLELHRVPGGRTRRRWLMETVEGGMPVIAISGGVRDDLVGLGVTPEQIHVEHDAADPGLAAALPPREQARAALGLDADASVVLYAGGLLEWKGVDVLVEAARADALDGATVLVVGGMEADVAALRARASGIPRLRIDGFRPAGAIPTYLAAADVGVVPNRRSPRISSHYTSPLKVFEAMAARLPQVVSDLPSLRDVLAQDQAIFVEPEDPAALAAGIRRVLGDADAARAMADRSHAAVATNTWDARAARILGYLEQAA